MESLKPYSTTPDLPLDAGDLWIDCRDQARRVVEFVLETEGPLVLLYGGRGIGKTSLIQKWVLTMLAPEHEAFYGNCGGSLPESVRSVRGEEAELWAAACRPGIVFLDSFETVLDLPGLERDRQIRRLWEGARTLGQGSKVAVVFNEDRLGRALVLHEFLPNVLDASFEIRPLGASDTEELRMAITGSPLGYEPAVIEAIAAEAGSLSPTVVGGVTPSLLRAVDDQLRQYPWEEDLVRLTGYRSLGGLQEILRQYLTARLDSLGEDRLMTLALLDELAMAERTGTLPDLDGLCLRTQAVEEDCRRFAQRLAKAGLLQISEGGRHELVPPLMAEVIRLEVLEETSEARRLLRQGVESWRTVAALLPPESFAAVHEERHLLRPTPEEAELMLRCAIRYSDDQGLAAPRYWLRRLPPETVRTELFSQLTHPQPEVRSRAAELLAGFDEHEVLSMLRTVALRDPEPQVRDRAISSLREMERGEDFFESLLQEVSDIYSPYRLAAVDTLRIFPSQRSVAALQRIVEEAASPPALRRRAIAVLAELDSENAASALVEIALQAEDKLDCTAAADRLAEARSPKLLNRALAALREGSFERQPAPRDPAAILRSAGRVAVSLLLVIASFALHGLLLLVLRRRQEGLALLALEGLAILILLAGVTGDAIFFAIATLAGTLLIGQAAPMGLLLRDRKKRRLPPGSLQGTLAIVVFLVNALTTVAMVHGLAHAALGKGKVRRALALFAIELAGAVVCFMVLAWPQLFYITVSALPEVLLYDGLRAAYFTLGVALLLGSYLYDVVRVAASTILHTRGHQIEARRQGLYRRLMSNPLAAAEVLDLTVSREPLLSKWARGLVRRFGSLVEPELLVRRLGEEDRRARKLFADSLMLKRNERTVPLLVRAWASEPPGTRRLIVKLLARRPTEASLNALRELRTGLDWRDRLRSWWGFWAYPFRVLPRALMLCLLFALPLLVILFYEGVHTQVASPARPFIKLLRYPDGPPEQRIGAAQLLAQAFPDEGVREIRQVLLKSEEDVQVQVGVVESLTRIASQGSPTGEMALAALAESLEQRGASPAVRYEVLQRLRQVAADTPAAVAMRAGPQLLAVLSDPANDLPTRQAALQALEASQATDAITSFIAGAHKPSSPFEADLLEVVVLNTGRAAEDEVALRHAAVDALRRIGTFPAYDALLTLGGQNSELRIPEELRSQARQDTEDPLEPLRRDLDAERFEAVLRDAPTFLGQNNVAQQEVLLLLGQASQRLAARLPIAEADRAQRLRRDAIKFLEEVRRDGKLPKEAARLLAESHVSEGDFLDRNRRKDEAREHWRLALAPDLGLPSMQRIRLLLQLGELDEMREAALDAAAEDPENAALYRLLRQSLVAQGKARAAESLFQEIKSRHPSALQPRFHLAYLYHEHISADDPSAFEKTRQQYVEMLEGEPDPQPLLLSILAEANLTTGRYEEAVRVANDYLATEAPSQSRALNTELIAYLALRLDGRSAEAQQRLNTLEARYLALPPTFRNTWVYNGVRTFLERDAGLPKEQRQPLLDLIRLIRARRPDAEAEPVFAANRQLLSQVTETSTPDGPPGPP